MQVSGSPGESDLRRDKGPSKGIRPKALSGRVRSSEESKARTHGGCVESRCILGPVTGGSAVARPQQWEVSNLQMQKVLGSHPRSASGEGGADG